MWLSGEKCPRQENSKHKDIGQENAGILE
jgi:hypothetical protein